MVIFFFTQRAMLELLDTTIRRTLAELRDQGLDNSNPVLGESFTKLAKRRRNTGWGSRLMLAFSIVPLLAVCYAAFIAPASNPSGYTITLTPTNGVQIIQAADRSGLILTNSVLPLTTTNSPVAKP
jgi:hypothetical protein